MTLNDVIVHIGSILNMNKYTEMWKYDTSYAYFFRIIIQRNCLQPCVSLLYVMLPRRTVYTSIMAAVPIV